MMRDEGELEAAYRLFSNPAVSPGSILDAHYRGTARRVGESDRPTIVVHDSTECCFRGDSDRADIGRLSNHGRGLSVHVALAVAPDGGPHGLLDLATHTRMHRPDKTGARKRLPRDQRESARWGRAVDAAMARLPAGAQVVHVMDREADSFLLFAELARKERAFVIRIGDERRLHDDEHGIMREALDEIASSVVREVRLSRRTDRNRYLMAKKTFPKRASRIAKLAIGARSVVITSNKRYRQEIGNVDLTLNVVRVWEPEAPAGEAPVEWVLLTNLPGTTAADLEVVVDAYRTRWTVEEYFKALKTGCAFEQRQLESRHALENALAILAPIACRLLLLRTLARRNPEAPAITVLTPTQIDVLREISVRFKLTKHPTAREVLLAIAGLGGFLKRNKEPGWQTIGLGFDELLKAERIWNLAKGAARSDQS